MHLTPQLLRPPQVCTVIRELLLNVPRHSSGPPQGPIAPHTDVPSVWRGAGPTCSRCPGIDSPINSEMADVRDTRGRVPGPPGGGGRALQLAAGHGDDAGARADTGWRMRGDDTGARADNGWRTRGDDAGAHVEAFAADASASPTRPARSPAQIPRLCSAWSFPKPHLHPCWSMGCTGRFFRAPRRQLHVSGALGPGSEL